MGLSQIYHKIVLLSPKIEVAVRSFYWNNVKWLRKYSSASSLGVSTNAATPVDFAKIISYLRENGVEKNDIMVIHSSFGALSGSGLSAEEVIDQLYSLVDDGGTLAMPAIRTFPEEGGEDYYLNYIDNEMEGVTTVYDIYKSKISSGLLPFTLIRYDDAEISKFPLNPLAAIGAHAEAMMEHNIEGELPTAHGPNSAWAYCANRNAWNIGIGVDIKDYLTIFHVTQEVPEWPVKDWYFERDFIIKKSKRETPLRIRERKHKWTKYMAETNFYNDLVANGILKVATIDGVPVYMTRSNDLFDFIKAQKNPTYPYFIPKKYMK
ncbi:MAG: AAC(3) family N-acetyltransferase [Muribaculaceae bacterium]|nr:AAC(3) family N-acetyltransferase [Muribaculaceae bacterium]